ncbi:uncharacterized protein LOC119082141 isoform X2 [Bradysia coprophila]|uniref:uncharacterized protein LOC119082141 isoform X1 n=1 Tax=Bradysia coprophila TaxID=38358 RepID=UPI00187D8E09|nr:uncharacterized protein LOC119082141 isoform X1 [Bradysia coprophila]XP_037047436.1 uncharacterized protein LOC119082141 isoform X2 [Bradysia coprophila]
MLTNCIELNLSVITKNLFFSQFKDSSVCNMSSRTNILIIAVLLVTNYKTVDGIALDCSYGIISWDTVGSVYTCTARVLFDNVDGSVTAIFGSHQTGKGHEDVGGIILEGQDLSVFPTNIEYFFPNMIGISLYNNSIPAVNNEHLAPFPYLQFLGLTTNKITSIGGNLFSGMNSMVYISFSNNNIRHVGHDLNLPINGRTYFSTTTCIDQTATTPVEVASLTLNLLRFCPPTISQIEESLENRQNLLTHVDSQVRVLRNGQIDLLARIENLERIIGSKTEAEPSNQFLIDASGN